MLKLKYANSCSFDGLCGIYIGTNVSDCGSTLPFVFDIQMGPHIPGSNVCGPFWHTPINVSILTGVKMFLLLSVAVSIQAYSDTQAGCWQPECVKRLS